MPSTIVPDVLVDTGPLVALADRRDRWHAPCVAWLKNFRGGLITTWPVLTEFSHLVPQPKAAIALYRWAVGGGLKIHALGQPELGATADWMERYADRPMDLADASLVLTAMALGVTQVWTLDRSDFEIYRLPNRKRFKLIDM